jgi:hypothetical protein
VGGESWHRLAVHYDAYGDWGGCPTAYADRSDGRCRGTFQGSGWNTTPPFHQSDGNGSNFEWGAGRPKMILLTNRLAYGHYLRGFVPGPESAALTITNGGSNGWLPQQWGPDSFPPLEPGRIQSGTDMAKIGQPGGPIRISVGYRTGGIFGPSGYTVDLNGYLWY